MKVLVIQPKIGMGDMVIYLPYIHAIANKYNSSVSILVKKNSRAKELLIDDKKIETIKKKFFNLKSNKDKSAFLYAKVYIKDETSNKIENFSDLQDINFLIRNILKISNGESLEIIRQSIPEKNPILYTEKIFKIL